MVLYNMKKEHYIIPKKIPQCFFRKASFIKGFCLNFSTTETLCLQFLLHYFTYCTFSEDKLLFWKIIIKKTKQLNCPILTEILKCAVCYNM